MNNQPHPVQRTLVFIAALCLIFSAILFRPEQTPFLGDLLPRWDDLVPSPTQMTSVEAHAILDTYRQPAVPDVSTTPTDSTPRSAVTHFVSDSVDSKSVVASHSQTPFAQHHPSGTDHESNPAARYDRHSIHQFLHRDLQLQGNPAGFGKLASFFQMLDAQDRHPPIHVFHFGDSQIEGDRMTGVLRNAWQEIWGGGGPGLLSPVQPVPSLSMRQNWSDGWNRYTRYGRKDSLIQHDRYGLMAAFVNHPPTDSSEASPFIEFTPHPKGYRRNQAFNQLHVLTGAVPSGSRMHYQLNDLEERFADLTPDSSSQHLVVSLPELDTVPFEALTLRFTGDIPELNAVGMWSDSGIVVHNVAMRGSSGTLFKSLDRAQFTKQLSEFRTGLIMLQYGGNAVPYLTEPAAIERYGNWFSAQIRLFQSILPETPIVVIGPSDMAQKINGRMETYPQLPLVRDALKQAAIQHDALYWDVFEVMGGAGSMAAWVQSDPALASADHIHFTPTGAREMADLFRKSLQAEWALWQNSQVEKSLVHDP